jgi:hypothetical protein
MRVGNLQVFKRAEVSAHYAVLDYLTPCEELLFDLFRLLRVLGDDYPHVSHEFVTDWYYYVFSRSNPAANGGIGSLAVQEELLGQRGVATPLKRTSPAHGTSRGVSTYEWDNRSTASTGMSWNHSYFLRRRVFGRESEIGHSKPLLAAGACSNES